MARKRKIKSRLKLKEEKGLEEVRKAVNDNKGKSRSNLIEKKGLEKVRKADNDNKAKSRAILRGRSFMTSATLGGGRGRVG